MRKMDGVFVCKSFSRVWLFSWNVFLEVYIWPTLTRVYKFAIARVENPSYLKKAWLHGWLHLCSDKVWTWLYNYGIFEMNRVLTFSAHDCLKIYCFKGPHRTQFTWLLIFYDVKSIIWIQFGYNYWTDVET